MAIRTLYIDTVDSLALEKPSVVGRTVKETKNHKRKKNGGRKKNLNYGLDAFGERGKNAESILYQTSYRVQSINCFMLDILCVYLN